MGDVLPFDIKLKILQFLDSADVFRASMVNKSFYIASKNETRWINDLTLTIENLADEKRFDFFNRHLRLVHFMSCLPVDPNTMRIVPDRLEYQVVFITFKADFKKHEFVRDKMSHATGIELLLNPTTLPPNSPRFVLFFFASDPQRKMYFLYWRPPEIPAKDLWDILYDTLIIKTFADKATMLKADTLPALANQLLDPASQIPLHMKPHVAACVQ
eukprot:c3610_g1_i1.p1 GENE.c3610_g1_i1~~c3610_g1_i1.p1  ORF type:complete len:215 (-),score=32.39 c3610_g1_i1:154-798(-)